MFSDTKYPVQQDQHFRYILVNKSQRRRAPIVFLHGLFGGLSNFEGLLDRFGDQHPLFVPELPLYNSKVVNPSVRSMTDWLIDIFDQFDIDRPIIVGNSMGGHMALDVALRYPKRAGALVLAGSSGLLENHFGQSKPRRYDRNYVKEQAARTFYEKELDDTIIDEIMAVLQDPAKLIRMLRLARSTQRYNLENLLEHIAQEVLLIWGRNDIITPPEVAESFYEKLPNAELKWIDRCGHAPMMERPDDFAKLMERFLSTRDRLTAGQGSIKEFSS